MERIKILLPYDGVSEEELKQAVLDIEESEVEFEEEQNLSGELICGISTVAINFAGLLIAWKALKVALESLNEARLANNKVTLIDNHGNIKRNILLKDVEAYLKSISNDSNESK